MINEKFMRNYVLVSMLLGFVLLLIVFLYQLQFTIQYNLEVETTMFIVTLLDYFEPIEILNIPLIVFLVLFVFNVLIAVLSNRQLQTDKQPLKEVAYLNLVFTILLIAGQILFVFMIPSQINGEPRDMVLFTEFPLLVDTIQRAINITYLVSFIYTVYNLVVLIQTKDKNEDHTDKVIEEELILAEFLKD